ncbi:unnamed protein product, partial [Mesorhabditis belari]|uniref:Saposin B-type domain-containing protein n=1 Tax=Mesorhabditis belari TaxID=2138241 RepID=A0AAF3FDK9_9BILA
MREFLRIFSASLLLSSISAGYLYDRWGNVNDDNAVNSVFERPRPPPSSPRGSTSNLGCFFCTQLLSVTKHRVGLSQNQLRNVLYEKCRVLPQVLREQCFTFVDRSLLEIYFSLNYDFSSKNSDITSFANNACAQMQRGRTQDQCYELADKKIDELAKFVDHQVIESALVCQIESLLEIEID